MKNLKLLSAKHELAVESDSFCVDLDKTVFFATSQSLYCLEKIHGSVSLCAELSCAVDNSINCIIGLEFLFENNSVFIASSYGDLYLYNIDEKAVSEVGCVETGLENFAWSPDQECLVLLTGAKTLILMTKDFDPITETNLCADEFGKCAPINVGWGSKTTQFHGSEGKGAAVAKQKEPKPALPYDDYKSRISWGKDGDYFVTSSVDATKGCRLLRIWDKDAELQFTSEIVEGLEESICWKPFANLIACSQQCPNKHKVIFFEKNGLQHGEFVLPYKPNTFKVTTLLWNSDSTVLLVVAQELSDNPEHHDVTLWTSSNYHWYLKQRFQLKNSTPYKSLVAKWSPFQSQELHCFNPNSGDFYEFHFASTILYSSGQNGCDDSIVASIDNENILISPFGKLLVPPPLCAYMYSLKYSIQSVFFAPNIPAFGVYLGNLKLALFYKEDALTATDSEDCKLKLIAAGGNGFKSQVKPYAFNAIYNINVKCSYVDPFGLTHWTWVNGNRLLCVCYCEKANQKSKFCLLSVELPTTLDSKTSELAATVVSEFDDSVVGLCSNVEGTIAAVQFEDGRVLQFKTDDQSVTPWLCDDGCELVLPQICTNMSVVSICGKDYVLGLSKKYTLFCNNVPIISSCTSYFVQEEFLLVTTVDHVLKCFSRKFDLSDALKNKATLPSEVQSQRIEKGARIIISPSNSTKVILQMPRGNLETIHPRSLVLSSICKHLDQLQFGKAFELAKVQRIDLNILFDHSPKQFLDNIELVFEQIPSPSDLNLFMASLKNEDVCVTMYPLMFERIHLTTPLSENKINMVCDAFRSSLETMDHNRYYQTLMATYAKKDPPELDQALIRLKVLKDSSSSKSTKNIVDGALNFLLYLVDVEALKLTALGTYDLETTIMVEQKSQKDPKEFLPFYNMLQNLEENYRKYKIDMHLRRYKQALLNISKCEDHFDECIALIKEQRLYTDALYLFPSSSENFKIIWTEYGNYLMEKRYFDDAGLVFTQCNEHAKALTAYRESVNWQMALCSAVSLKHTKMETIALSEELARKLISCQRYIDASYLLEQYVENAEESIVALIEGCEWNMALFKISKHDRHDIAETHLKPALKEHFVYLKTHLEQNFETFEKHSERLKVLRTQKKQEAEMPNHQKYAEDDLFSDTGSVTDAASSVAESKQMSGSIMTRKSSKSRRKQKLKKYRLKEGSADEDLALIVALSEIVTKVDSLKDNFLNTLRAMVHYGYNKQAEELKQLMSRVAKQIQDEIPNIWNPAETSTTSNEMKFGPDSTANSIAAGLQKENQVTAPAPKDPELAPPTWRHVDITLQMFK
ncbi:hypothetical protein JTE90_029395 [Oedothorax gibbosus]|uniref:Elongator complex protein 1 n=1 Tax=Oedothorax gibbosus TaxID=931172 RepID=A0AAV6VQH4_9ARAC|nr:hypothetical protein JTE90_029395 [Oedothorax gibbosus]